MEEKTLYLLNKLLILATVLVVGVLVFFVGQMIYQSQLLDQQNQNQISVSGEGKIYVKPDVAMISLGVESQAKTVADVTKDGTEKMNAVIEAVKKLGIKGEDIKTTNYSLNPVYDNYSVSSPEIMPMMYPDYGVGTSSINRPIKTSNVLTGYRLNQNIQVKIRDFTKIGEALTVGTSSGANLVGDLQFTIDDPEQFRTEARIEAIKQAKEKAKVLAKTAGIRLGKLVNVYENYYSPMMYDSLAKGMGGGVESAPAPVIEPGQQEISVTVNLTYKVK